MTDDGRTLLESTRALVERHDVALLDLDGVVYLGQQPIPGVPEALSAARAAGMRLAFVTNNASRAPETVADLLGSLGIEASPEQVVTSAQAAARLLAEHLPAGSRVLVIGAPALRAEVQARGLQVVESAEDSPQGVVQGFSAEIGWRDLAEAVVAVRAGAWWVATNTDFTLPSPRGVMPGNGSLVGVVADVTKVSPVAAGKPEPALHRESVERTGARTPLVVGDRLDTDIEGASKAGSDSLLVFTGVTEPVDLLTAPPQHRPSFLAPDLTGLLVPHPAPRRTDSGWACGGWTATSAHGRATLAGDGDEWDALRALCAATWRAGSTGPRVQVEPGAEPAAKVIDKLALG